MSEIAKKACQAMSELEEEHGLLADKQADVHSLLTGTGLRCEHRVEPPPEDMAYLFEYWGAGGNSGISGQTIVEANDHDNMADRARL